MHEPQLLRSSAGPAACASRGAGSNLLPVDSAMLTIAAVERDTGLSKDLLRVWERRYGFPTPARDASGERAYPLEQVARLRVVKRLLDAGYRPGRMLALDAVELQRLATATSQADNRQAHAGAGAAFLADEHRRLLLATLRSHDLQALRTLLERLIAQVGLHDFVLQRACVLNAAVADAWLHGQLEAFEERAYQQQLQTLLRLAAARHADEAAATPAPALASAFAPSPVPVPSGEGGEGGEGAARAPRVLLTTFPGETAAMGLVLAEALLTLRGCACITLGTQLAPWDTVRAAEAYGADIVALTFSGSLSPNAVVQGLTELRAKLPQALTLWASGSAPVLQRRRVPGVQALVALKDVPSALARWQANQAAGSAAATA